MPSHVLSLVILGPIFLVVLVSLLVIGRQSACVQSKLERYAAANPLATRPQFPPEVQAVFAEAKARATALPTDAQAIALDYCQQVAPPYRENLVRLVYFTAGIAQGMDPMDAVRRAGQMWAQVSAKGDERQPLAS